MRKVGDKVKIKSIDWYNKNKDNCGGIYSKLEIFVSGMAKYCGEKATIIYVNEDLGTYKLDIDEKEDRWHWTDEMFEEEKK